jgi:hypothetical protein
MNCCVAHPYGQLQLELPGLAPLTNEEVELEWLGAVPSPWTRDAIRSALFIEDRASRDARAERRHWIWYLQNRLPADGFGMVGGAEVAWLYFESIECFIAGHDVATILCAHALCERALAGFLEIRNALKDRLWKAGLGPVSEAAHRAGFIDQELLDDLQIVTETRKGIAHFRPPLDPASVHMRLLAAYEEHTGSIFDVESMLNTDAQAALTAATRVLERLSELPWGTPPDAGVAGHFEADGVSLSPGMIDGSSDRLRST